MADTLSILQVLQAEDEGLRLLRPLVFSVQDSLLNWLADAWPLTSGQRSGRSESFSIGWLLAADLVDECP